MSDRHADPGRPRGRRRRRVRRRRPDRRRADRRGGRASRRRAGADRRRRRRAAWCCRGSSTTTPTCPCRSWACGPPTTTTRARRRRPPAASRASSTSRSSASPTACARRWRSGRAARTAPRTSTTASTWRSPTPTTPTHRRHAGDGRGGRVELQAVHGLQGRADGARRRAAAAMERARDLGALVMVHAENGDVVDLLVKRALARGRHRRPIDHALTRPEFVEAEATGRAARLAEYTGASLFVVHVTCAAAAAEIEAAQQRGAARQRARRARSTSSTRSTTCAARASRAVATSARRRCATPSNHEPLWDYVRRGVLESVSTDHCPFNDEQKARGARRLQPRAQRPAGDPAPAGQAVGRGRRRRAHHAEPARRPHEHDDRAPLRPGRQGRDRARARTPTSSSSTRQRRGPTASRRRS